MELWLSFHTYASVGLVLPDASRQGLVDMCSLELAGGVLFAGAGSIGDLHVSWLACPDRYEVFRRAIVDIPPRPTRPPAQLPTRAADSNIVSSAAAFAASLSNRKRKGRSSGASSSSSSTEAEAIQYCIYLHSPELSGELEALQAGCVSNGGIGDHCWAVAGQRSNEAGGSTAGNTNSSMSDGSSLTHTSPPDVPDSGSAAQEGGGAAVAPATGCSTIGSMGRLLSGAALESLPWVPVTMIANLPHIEVRYTPGAAPGLDPISSYFMLDSGASLLMLGLIFS